jgi:formaldehyde-activating enzyme involved in methanogenesis
MLPVVAVLLPGGSERARAISMNSARLAIGSLGSVVEAAPCNVIGIASDSQAELVHFISPGTIVMPYAYRAVSTWIEDSKKDFILFGLFRLGVDRAFLIDGDQAVASRMVVRKWVVLEFGFPKEGADVFAAGVISEYMGVEIPHVLCVETFE